MMSQTEGMHFLPPLEHSRAAAAALVDSSDQNRSFQLESESLAAPEHSAKSMSNLTSASGEASLSSETRSGCDGIMISVHKHRNSTTSSSLMPSSTNKQLPLAKRKRNLPGNPDPEAQVIALSPKTLMATNRFLCEICGKGFQRDQNLQLHRRGHNLPWKLRQRTTKDLRRRVYVCPEKSCVHHDPSRALGDLTGIKKHFCRKHGEKKWKCDKCSKKYAVHSDWKAHRKTCGTREYKCDCGTLFSRRDSFITHRAFCDALAEESAKLSVFRSEGGQFPGCMGQESCLSSANFSNSGYPLQPAISATHLSRSLPNFLGMGMSLPHFEYVAGADVSSSRYEANSSMNTQMSQVADTSTWGMQTNGRSKTDSWVNPNPMMSDFPLSSEMGAKTTIANGVPGNYQTQALTNRSQNFAVCTSEVRKHTTEQLRNFHSQLGITEKWTPLNPVRMQLSNQSSLSTSQTSCQEQTIGSLFSSTANSDARDSLKMVQPIQGQNVTSSGVLMASDCALFSPSRQTPQQTLKASPMAAGICFPSSAGPNCNSANIVSGIKANVNCLSMSSLHGSRQTPRPQMSATALLQKAAQMGATVSNSSFLRHLGLSEGETVFPYNLLRSKQKLDVFSQTQPCSFIRAKDNITDGVPTQARQLTADPTPNNIDALENFLGTRSNMSLAESSSNVDRNFNQTPQPISLNRCHAGSGKSSFAFGINRDVDFSNDFVAPHPVLVAKVSSSCSTSTADNRDRIAGQEQIYTSFPEATSGLHLPNLDGDAGKESRYETSTRDFLGVVEVASRSNARSYSTTQENPGKSSLNMQPSMIPLNMNHDPPFPWKLFDPTMDYKELIRKQ